MPRTRSAAKQARASRRRQLSNKSIKSKLHTLERKFLALVEGAASAPDVAKTTEATAVFRDLSSALDKAAKTQVIHRNLASRKKSRLSARIRALTPKTPAKTV